MTDEHDFSEWFFEFLIGFKKKGGFRKRYDKTYDHEKRMKYWRNRWKALPKHEREKYLNRGNARAKVVDSSAAYMVRRKKKGLGTYNPTHHVVAQDNKKRKFRDTFNAAFKDAGIDVAQEKEKTRQTRFERGKDGSKWYVLRDKKGRIVRREQID